MSTFIVNVLKEIEGSGIFSGENGLSPSIGISLDESKTVLISGDNASGKSFVSRFIGNRGNENGYFIKELCSFSQANVVANSIKSGKFINGDSAFSGSRSLEKLFREVDKFKSAKEPFLFIVESPELGIDDSYLRSLGQYLAESITDLMATGNCVGLVVVSNNKKLSQSICNYVEVEPNVIYMGGKYQSYWDWLMDDEEDKTLHELLSLPGEASFKRDMVESYLFSDERV